MKYFIFFISIIVGVTSQADAQQSATPAAIDAFWKKTREALQAIPIDAKVEKVDEPLPYRKYLVTVRSLGNVTVAGYLTIPISGEAHAKPWPVIVTVPGYSGRQVGVMQSECQRGYAILQVYPRGQGISEKYFKLERDKLAGKLDNPEGAYYQAAYADVMRMIDYIVTRPDIDSNRIAMVATSQGGGISLAVTALDKRVKAVVAHVPFLCNMRLAATMPSLVKNLLDKAKSNNEAAYQTLDYFDPLQLSSHITVPVLMSAGGKDVLCPQQTVQSVYDKITSNKQLIIYSNLPHTSCNDFYNQTWPWLEKNFRKPTKKKKNRQKIVFWQPEK